MRYGVFSVRCSVQWSWPTTFCRARNRTWPGLSACLCPVVKCVIRGSKGGDCKGGMCANSDFVKTRAVSWPADSASVVTSHCNFPEQPLQLIEVAQSSAALTTSVISGIMTTFSPEHWGFLSPEIFSGRPRIIVQTWTQSWTHAQDVQMCVAAHNPGAMSCWCVDNVTRARPPHGWWESVIWQRMQEMWRLCFSKTSYSEWGSFCRGHIHID